MTAESVMRSFRSKSWDTPNEEMGMAAVGLVKYFTPYSNWTWYASEFDGKDRFFGLVSGFEIGLGYFLLSELASLRGPMRLPIERDLHYVPVRRMTA
jgi:hypothetical protein